MPSGIRIKSEKARAGLQRLEREQLPFAMARALTEIARQAQRSITLSTKQSFKNSTPWYAPGSPIGVKIVPATKTHLESQVRSFANFGPLQEKGGTKLPFSGTHIAIPSAKVKQKKRRWSGGTRRGQTGKMFRINLDNGDALLVQRTSKNKPPETLYYLAKKANIVKRWGFIEIGKKVFKRRFASNFKSAMSQALSTAFEHRR